jgi:hypothetical protein
MVTKLGKVVAIGISAPTNILIWHREYDVAHCHGRHAITKAALNTFQ